MTYQVNDTSCTRYPKKEFIEKLDWLRKIFSNDPQVRAEAMNTEILQPLFDSQEDFARALKELEHDRRRN